MKFEFEIKAPDAERRVDRFVQRALGNVPDALVRRLLRNKKVRVNGERAQANQRLAAGDRVVVHHVPRTTGEVQMQRPSPSDDRIYTGPPIGVLGEHESFLFIAKPAGVSCSDDGQDPLALTLWLREFLCERLDQGEVRPEPCHRLDRGTTGVVAIALTASAFDRFRRALQQGRVHKEYEVAVAGSPPADVFDCELPLVRRDDVRAHEPRVVAATAEQQREAWNALTRFEVLRRAERAALLAARPMTGRTHQIRAHCHALGLPVLGDPRYGVPTDGTNHQLLHARRLTLDDAPTAIEVEAPWPTAEVTVLAREGLVG